MSSSSAINISQPLLNMEGKLVINPYQSDIDALKFNHSLQHLDFYSSVHHICNILKLLKNKLPVEFRNKFSFMEN
jgi:hypothetical protein